MELIKDSSFQLIVRQSLPLIQKRAVLREEWYRTQKRGLWNKFWAKKDMLDGRIRLKRGERAEERGERAEERGERADKSGERAEERGERAEMRGKREDDPLFVRVY